MWFCSRDTICPEYHFACFMTYECFVGQKSAKDNRVKRKEYVRQLEEEVRRCNARNSQLQQKVENLSEENKYV